MIISALNNSIDTMTGQPELSMTVEVGQQGFRVPISQQTYVLLGELLEAAHQEAQRTAMQAQQAKQAQPVARVVDHPARQQQVMPQQQPPQNFGGVEQRALELQAQLQAQQQQVAQAPRQPVQQPAPAVSSLLQRQGEPEQQVRAAAAAHGVDLSGMSDAELEQLNRYVRRPTSPTPAQGADEDGVISI